MSSNLQHLRILVVEDQEATRTMLRDMCRSIGAGHVTTAEDGTAALKAIDAAAEKPNVIICDWVMPGMSGVDLLIEVKKKLPNTPFLMVTGKTDKDAVKTAVERGVAGYIVKPFSRAQIEVKLQIIGRKLAGQPAPA